MVCRVNEVVAETILKHVDHVEQSAAIGAVNMHVQARVLDRRQSPKGVIGSAIVEYDDLDVGIRTRQYGGYQFMRPQRTVVGGDTEAQEDEVFWANNCVV